MHLLDLPARPVLYYGDGRGDELAGAHRAGMTALVVAVRDDPDTTSEHDVDWNGPVVKCVEQVPRLVSRGGVVAAGGS